MKSNQSREGESLLATKTKSYDENSHKQPAPSRLEWAESSWTRWLHILCWWWVNPILSLGYKRVITDNDLDDLPSTDKCATLLERVQSYNWTVIETWKIIVREFWKEYMTVGLLCFPYVITRIAQPLVIRYVVTSIDNTHESPIPAYLYAALLLFCTLVQVFVQQPLNFYSSRIGIKIRNALTLMICEHALSSKIVSSEQSNTAQIITLVATDTTKIEDTCKSLHYFWAIPLEVMIISGLLCWIIGPLPTVLGYIIFIPFTCIQLIFIQKFNKHRKITASCTEKRVNAFSEFIHGYYIIKAYNWEKLVEDRIDQLRHDEVSSIRRAYRLRAINQVQFFVATPLLALTTFGSMWLLKYPLNSIDIFTALGYFNLMRHSVACLMPTILERLSEVRFSFKRIDTFLRHKTAPKEQVPVFIAPSNQGPKGSISISDATFSWNNEKICLFSLNILIEPATFVGIIGTVGSGKTALFSALLGELNLVNGELNTYQSSFSYAPQVPWIFADTLRNNIIFGRPFEEQRYQNVISACCLDVDINLFGPSRDLILIGEKGVNLSGGQKSRVSLARALYANADIYLLDDPLSAVDRAVAKRIYERCIGLSGLLKNKTRLLITHQTQFVAEAHQVIVLHDGHIVQESYMDESRTRNDETTPKETLALTSMLDLESSSNDLEPIIKEEISISGSASWSLWLRLFTASSLGLFGFCLLVILLLTGEFLYDVSNYWLKIWSKQAYSNQQEKPLFFYIYFGLIVVVLFVDLLRTNYFFSLMLHGSNRLHNTMLKALLSTSMQFFESNPSGRILNRLTRDQQVIDEFLPTLLFNGVEWLLMVVGSTIIICFITPYVLLSFIVIVPIFWFLSHFCLKSSREIKRLESVTRSPVYALFSTVLRGLTTIRAFRAKEHFMDLLIDKIDRNTRVNITILGVMQWISLRFNLIACLVMFVTVVVLIFLRNQIELSSIGLSLTSTISLILWFSWGIRQLVETTIFMTSAERIDEYGQLSCEEDQNRKKRWINTPPKWASQGTIEFRNYSLRYRADVSPALKNLTIRIESNEKVGIIGRTGAGKSSLFHALFRFIDQSNVEGAILIDDIDISRIPLDHLRSRLCVIPQQPILFSGTLRHNLDPFNQYSDEQCWMALESVQLKEFISKNPAGLLMTIAESGSNLSTGQCQLVCIARGILKKSKIVLIDEATANIDEQTDKLIQEIIADQFQDCTVLTIAHRLNTVAKSDRILVLDEGCIVHFDIPSNILHYYQ